MKQFVNIRSVLVVLLAAISSHNFAQAQTPDDNALTAQSAKNSIFYIEVEEGGERKYLFSGVAIKPNRILTVELPLRTSDYIYVTDSNGIRLPAEILERDVETGLAVLDVPMADYPFATFAKGGDVSSQSAVLRFASNRFARSELKGRVDVDDSVDASRFAHTSAATSPSFGGGIFNGCDQLIGLNYQGENYSRRSFRQGDRAGGVPLAIYVAGAEQAILGDASSFEIASAPCEVDLTGAEDKAKEQELEAQRAEAQAAKDNALELERKATELEEKAAALQEEAAASDAEKADAQAKADAAREDAEDAQRSADDTAQDLREAEAELDEALIDLDEKTTLVDELEDKLGWLAILSGIALALILLVTGLLLRARKRRLIAAQSDIASAKSEAVVAQKQANQYRDMIPERYSDCVLEGGSRNLRLSGTLLPETSGGVIVGRHPGKANAVLEAEDVSRQHARFSVTDNKIYLEDLGSTFGTQIDNIKIRPGEKCLVKAGSKIKFASHEFVFRKI